MTTKHTVDNTGVLRVSIKEYEEMQAQGIKMEVVNKPTADLTNYIKFLISPEAERMADGTRLTNLIVAVTELMEQKPTAEVSVGDIANKIEELYASGEYDAKFRKQLIINTLNSHTTALKGRVDEELGEWVAHNAKTITHNNGAREYVDVRDLLEFITNIT